MTALESAQQLKAKFGDLISEPAEFRGEITVKVADAEQIAEVCEFAKKQLGFDYLVDITSVDNYGDDPRWTVVYHLRGYRPSLRIAPQNRRERGKIRTADRYRRLAHGQLARARNLRHDGHPVSRPSRFAPDFDVGRLSVFSVAQGFSAGGQADRICRKWLSPKPAPLEGGPFVTVAGGKRRDCAANRARMLGRTTWRERK